MKADNHHIIFKNDLFQHPTITEEPETKLKEEDSIEVTGRRAREPVVVEMEEHSIDNQTTIQGTYDPNLKSML